MVWRDVLDGRELPVLMGVVNVTPDSFSDGGLFLAPDAAVEHGLRLADEGAALLDVGGESTRPPAYGAAEDVSPEREIERVVTVIEALARRSGVPVSIDTRKSAVARAAIAAGASIVNDVTAMRFDPAMAGAAARAGAAAVLMHMRGTDPRTMQNDLAYAEPIAEIAVHLRDAASRAEAAGMARARIAIDPGLGFGKSASHSLLLVARLRAFSALGFPLVVGASRKGFTARFSGVPSDAPPRQRLAGSLACAAAAAERGAAVLRVHDVGETARFLAALRRGEPATAAADAVGASPDAFATMAGAIRRAERTAPESGG
jgi:dihydropteroate synthase